MLKRTPAAKVLAYSVCPRGTELITYEIWCHRWILAEINRHRVLSQSFRSSRAVPTAKLMAELRGAPAKPIMWGKNRPGMQSVELMTTAQAAEAEIEWRDAASNAADSAQVLLDIGLHKQWANRLLEPFLFVAGVITGTDWENFWALRRHDDAQPEFHALADVMWDVKQVCRPVPLAIGELHAPYIEAEEHAQYSRDVLLRLSAARCARVSYAPHDGSASIDAELARFDRLMGSQPKHASPTEHQAWPDSWDGERDAPLNPKLSGNFAPGWIQYRKTIPDESEREIRR